MRVLICGSRKFGHIKSPKFEDDQFVMERIIEGLFERDGMHDSCVIEGEAPGADRLARDIAKMFGIPVKPYPADWGQYGKAAGYIRNQQMLDEGKPDLVVAFYDATFGRSKGTAMMVDIARKAGVKTWEIFA